MFPVSHRKIFYAISGVVIAICLGSMIVFGLNFGIDFTGGSLLEVGYTTRPDKTDVEARLAEVMDTYSLREAGESGYVLRTRDISEDEHHALKAALSDNGAIEMEEQRFTSIGPTIGQELRTKAIWAFLLVLLAITLYIAFAFRKVSKPVSSWIYGGIVVATLLHDILLPLGIFAILGVLFGIEVDSLFLTAILVVLGYSINDTVVVFDRVRERLRRNEDERRKEDFEITVGQAVTDTYGRSINTTATTLIALLSIYIFGGQSTELFALALLVGVAAGGYSSIFLSAPLLVTIQQWQNKRTK